MAAKVGKYLKHESIKLRFTATHATNNTAKSILKRSLNQSIAEIISPSYVIPSTPIILYERLDVSIVELEIKTSMVHDLTAPSNPPKSMGTYPGADLTTDQLLDALSRRVEHQRSIYGNNIKNSDFHSMVRNWAFSFTIGIRC